MVEGARESKRRAELIDDLERTAIADLQDDNAPGVGPDVDNGDATSGHAEHPRTVLAVKCGPEVVADARCVDVGCQHVPRFDVAEG
jgi:hypothetical protein